MSEIHNIHTQRWFALPVAPVDKENWTVNKWRDAKASSVTTVNMPSLFFLL